MDLHKKDLYLDKIISYIKFPFDREDIREEINNHILDKLDYYEGKGYEKDQAEEMAINAMGDAEEIGKQLNKEHNPIIGWIWKITNYIITLALISNILVLILWLPSFLLVSNSRGIPRKEILWKQTINERVEIDDRVIKFKDLIYDKSGNLYIGYSYYDKRLWGRAWSFNLLWDIRDDLGGEYRSGSGHESGGTISKGRWKISGFNKSAKSITINQEIYDRKYTLEIPLKAGGHYD